MPNRCDRRYLQILELAAKEGEARVDDALRLLLASESGRSRTTRSRPRSRRPTKTSQKNSSG
jgi:hypothetical protein